MRISHVSLLQLRMQKLIDLRLYFDKLIIKINDYENKFLKIYSGFITEKKGGCYERH